MTLRRPMMSTMAPVARAPIMTPIMAMEPRVPPDCLVTSPMRFGSAMKCLRTEP